MCNFDTNESAIYRFRLGGDEEQRIVDNAIYLQVVDDSIYYCEADADKTIRYCKADLEGKNEEVILDKEIYLPYLLGNTLFYQDDADNETIHMMDLNTKEDVRITTQKTYGYILNDDYMYCILNDNSTLDEDYDGTLAKVDLKTLESTVLYDGASTFGFNVKDDKLFFINTKDENRIYSIDKNGENISIVTQDSDCWQPLIYGDQMIYMDAADDYEYIADIFICNLDGSDKRSIQKEY